MAVPAPHCTQLVKAWEIWRDPHSSSSVHRHLHHGPIRKYHGVSRVASIGFSLDLRDLNQ